MLELNKNQRSGDIVLQSYNINYIININYHYGYELLP